MKFGIHMDFIANLLIMTLCRYAKAA